LHGSFWSLIPFLIVIPLSVITKQVLPGLMTGLLVGAFMLHPSPLGGVISSLDYILKEIAIPDNLRLIVFLYGFGSFVGLVRVTGGVSGFAAWMSNRIQRVRGAFAVTWLSSLATFMAPDFRIITVAPVMKQVFEKLHVPAQSVAFAIEVTSTPLCAIIPIGTVFVGYMVGLIGTSLRHQSIGFSAYHLLLLSIPFNFFAILMLVYGLYTTFFRQSDVRQNLAITPTQRVKLSPESRLRLASQFAHLETASEITPSPSAKGRPDGQSEVRSDLPDPPTQTDDAYPDAVEWVSEQTKPHIWNLILPLALLLGLTLLLTWWDGHGKGSNLFSALANANAAKAMLEALLITLIVSVVWYTSRKQPIQRTMFGFLAGGNEMMGVIVLLVLVWAVSAVSTDLGFVDYTERTIGGLVPPAFIAPALFLFGCAISYVIGSSFGTWGMLLPLGFSLAASTHASLPLIAGAVFASGTFGGFASPLSDNTVAMATVMKLPLMSYAKMKLKASVFVGAASTVLYALAGWLLPGTA
jgi:tetracycline resistance efflux pump